MGRRAARMTHLVLSLLALLLFVLFVIPRWWVLTGVIPSTLGAVGRIAAGVPVAAAAVPVALTLQRAIRPGGDAAERVPELALRLRAWSAVLHVAAGVLIVLTAIAEIWLRPDGRAGPWLFAVYGGAAAIAILAVLAFVLSFVAEKPPGPPRPANTEKAVKVKKAKAPKPEKAEKRGKLRGRRGVVVETSEATEATESVEDTEAVESVESVETVTVEDTEGVESLQAPAEPAGNTEPSGEPTATGLRNKRPMGKNRHRLSR